MDISFVTYLEAWFVYINGVISWVLTSIVYWSKYDLTLIIAVTPREVKRQCDIRHSYGFSLRLISLYFL